MEYKFIEKQKGKLEEEVSYTGGNIATLLMKLDRTALEYKDFSRAVIIGADFTHANLRYTNLAEANLTESFQTRW